MRFPRRAPREVYRVYDEDRFLAAAGHEQAWEAPVATAGAGRARRWVSTAMLFGAVGAVGGLIAVNGLAPPKGTGRRIGGGLRAAAGLLISSGVSHARIWRARPTVNRSASLGVSRGRRWTVDRYGHGAVALPHELAQVPSHAEVPIDLATVATAATTSVARVAASAPSLPKVAGYPEFGFER
jgi:hypothetical protein